MGISLGLGTADESPIKDLIKRNDIWCVNSEETVQKRLVETHSKFRRELSLKIFYAKDVKFLFEDFVNLT